MHVCVKFSTFTFRLRWLFIEIIMPLIWRSSAAPSICMQMHFYCKYLLYLFQSNKVNCVLFNFCFGFCQERLPWYFDRTKCEKLSLYERIFVFLSPTCSLCKITIQLHFVVVIIATVVFAWRKHEVFKHFTHTTLNQLLQYARAFEPSYFAKAFDKQLLLCSFKYFRFTMQSLMFFFCRVYFQVAFEQRCCGCAQIFYNNSLIIENVKNFVLFLLFCFAYCFVWRTEFSWPIDRCCGRLWCCVDTRRKRYTSLRSATVA